MKPDKHVMEVCQAYIDRMYKGYDKYGVTTERTDIDLQGWLQHLQEELMDATVYLQRVKYELRDAQLLRDSAKELSAITKQVDNETSGGV